MLINAVKDISGHDCRILENIPSANITLHREHNLGISAELCFMVFALASSKHSSRNQTVF